MTFTLRSRRAKHAGRICKMCSLFFFEKIRSCNIETFHVPSIWIFWVERISNRKNWIYAWQYVYWLFSL